MAKIPKTGIVTGQTVEANHITNIIDALDGTGSFDIIATGSFSGSFVGELVSPSGLTYPIVDGNANEVLKTDGAGTLSFGFSDRIVISVKNTFAATLPEGTPVYLSGFLGAGTYEVQPASASNAATMPAIGVLSQELTTNAQGYATVLGAIKGIDTAGPGWSVQDPLYVDTNGGLTNVQPTGANLIQKIGRVGASAVNGEITILGAGRSNATPNLLTGQVFFGVGNEAVQKSFADILAENSYSYTGSFLIQGGNAVRTDLADNAEQVIGGTLRLSGDVIAENYIISSSVTYQTQSFSSGSTIFGDTILDDTHQFTGSVSITGSFLVNGSEPLPKYYLEPSTAPVYGFPKYQSDGSPQDGIAIGDGAEISGSSPALSIGTRAGNNQRLANELGPNYGSYGVIAIGDRAFEAGHASTDGIFIGKLAGRSSSYADNGVYIGVQAGRDAWNAYQGVFIGYQPGYGYSGSAFPNTGNEIAIGWQALYLGDDAGNSISLGKRAGYLLTSGKDGVMIGQEAGQQSANISSLSNSIFSNQFIGYRAGRNFEGRQSTLLGNNAGYLATGVTGSVALGYSAMQNADNINNTVAVGYQALVNSNSASSATAIGPFAMGNAGGSANSTAVGYQALNSAGNAITCLALGYQAGYNADNASGTVFIGYRSGFGSTTLGDNNIIIGSNVTLPASSTNTLNIGNVLYGTNVQPYAFGGAASSTPLTSGKIGIAKIPVNGTFDMIGDAVISGSIYTSANFVGDLTGTASLATFTDINPTSLNAPHSLIMANTSLGTSGPRPMLVDNAFLSCDPFFNNFTIGGGGITSINGTYFDGTGNLTMEGSITLNTATSGATSVSLANDVDFFLSTISTKAATDQTLFLPTTNRVNGRQIIIRNRLSLGAGGRNCIVNGNGVNISLVGGSLVTSTTVGTGQSITLVFMSNVWYVVN